MLGSDCPWENPAESVKYVLGLPVSDDYKEKILGKNAINFYGIEIKK